MLHDNVKVTLAYTVLSTVAGSIALGGIFSNYVYLVTDGSNSKVGYITGLNGLAMVVVAPFCGWWADKHRRDWMLRVAGIVGVIMAVATMVGVSQSRYPLLCACLVGWGMYGGIQSPAMEALFADSVEPGERSRIFTMKYALTQAGSAVGPACSMAMFFFLGDEWAIPQCQHVIIAGLVLCLLPSLLLSLFDDDKASLSHSPQRLERQRREHEEKLMLARQASAGNEEAPSRALTLPLLSAPTGAGGLEEGEEEEEEEGPAASGENSSADESRGRALCCYRPSSNGQSFCAQNYIPTVIVITDVCFALASGMSIKFFPLMFMETYDLSPMMVSLLYVVSPLATAFASFVAQRASRRLGRVATTIGFKFAGVALLALMCYLDYVYPIAALVAPIFVLRTACMNCTKALTRSIVMDAVPKETRAKWNSLESVTGATWAGSAVIGGLFVDQYGFLLNNLATAALQFCSTLPLFLVLGMVPTEHVTPAGGLLYEGVVGSAGVKEEEEEQLTRSVACKALFPQPSEADTEDLEVAKRLAEERRLMGEADPALDAPLEEEGDLGLLERLLKGAGEGKGGGRRGRVGRASTIGESC